MTATTLPSPPLDHQPWLRVLVAAAAAAVFAVCIFGSVRWLAGLSPPTPWVRGTALAIHLVTVIPAIPLGAYVLFFKKGGSRHKLLGRIWLGLMTVTAVSTLFIRNLNDGQFSWIHLLTLTTFIAVPKAIVTARRGDFAEHRKHLLLFYAGSMIIAGGFTFLPGRTMWQWAFG